MPEDKDAGLSGEATAAEEFTAAAYYLMARHNLKDRLREAIAILDGVARALAAQSD